MTNATDSTAKEAGLDVFELGRRVLSSVTFSVVVVAASTVV